MAEALRRPGHICTIVQLGGAAERSSGGSFDVVVTDLRDAELGRAGSPEGSDAVLQVLRRRRSSSPPPRPSWSPPTAMCPPPAPRSSTGRSTSSRSRSTSRSSALVNRAAEAVLLRHESADSRVSSQRRRVRGHRRRFGGDAAHPPPVKAVAPLDDPGADHRRERHRQGAHRPRRSTSLSPARTSAIVTINCAGQAESLLEDQLFGHVRGRLHRRGQGPRGRLRVRRRRHALPRRDRRHAAHDAGQAPPRARDRRGRAPGLQRQPGADVRFVSATNKDLRARW
jgi:hypothetical protein